MPDFLSLFLRLAQSITMSSITPLLPMDIELINSGSFPHMLFIATILLVYTFQLFTFLMSIPRLLELHRFYEHLLGVPDVRPLLNPALYITSTLYLHSLLSPL